MATTTLGSPRNHAGHGSDGCRGCTLRLPLTLADRQAMHARPLIVHDQTRDGHAAGCSECLADLPHGLAALFHVCPVTR